ncbi:WG repeat-containing protein, partial [Campylobacter jejuni]|uniref:WG repeat-containing protein n=2 Tax=Bacteria TaxID=2 RepID=UPI003529E673
DYYLPDGTCLATGVDAIIKWHGNALEIQNGWEYGVVDQTGREILPCIYDSSPTLDPYVDFIALSRKVQADGSATETRNDVV